MKLNKIKLALGFVTAAAMAMPIVASAAADQEKAMKNSANWALTLVVSMTTRAIQS